MLLAAAIWGSTFVAQQLGMDAVGPFTYTGARMVLGAALIAPLWWWRGGPFRSLPQVSSTGLWRAGLLLGCVLFVAINLQQVGLLGTTVSNAGFITGLYVVLVPILMRLLGQSVPAVVWLAVVIACVGLYFLSVQPGAVIAPGDWLQLGSAFVWALHVLLVGHWARRHDAIRLSLLQYVVAGALSWLAALWRDEPITLAALQGADWGGLHPASRRPAQRARHACRNHLQQRGHLRRHRWLVDAGRIDRLAGMGRRDADRRGHAAGAAGPARMSTAQARGPCENGGLDLIGPEQPENDHGSRTHQCPCPSP
jgi:hypothetical protein